MGFGVPADGLEYNGLQQLHRGVRHLLQNYGFFLSDLRIFNTNFCFIIHFFPSDFIASTNDVMTRTSFLNLNDEILFFNVRLQLNPFMNMWKPINLK